MTDGQQIALAIAPTVLPTLTVLIGILMSNRQIDSLRSEMRSELGGLRSEMRQGFAAVDREFELTRELFTEKLLRVEGVMDARLKHLEEQK